MKKLIAILFCFIAFKSFGQFPINATNGTPTTTVLTRGMSASDSGYWFRTAFPDTVSANYGRIEEIGGVMVRTIDGSIWLRNNAETKWIKLGDLTPITGCNALLQGGVVTYAGSGLVFDVSPATYIINCGGPYQSPQTQVTLAAADPSNPRFDVIYADVNGVVGVITGTAAATPSAPQVDPTTQIQLTFIRVDAGSTTPPLVTTETIYDENLSTPSEWATTATGVSVDYNNTTAPFHLTKAGSTGAIAQGNNLTFTNNVDVTLTDYTALKFYIHLKATFVQATQLNLSWYEGGVRVSTGVVVSHNNYGFDRTIVGSYQVITIPISAWAASLTESTVDQLIINITGSNASGFYIDWIQLQAGIPGGGSTTIPTFQQTLIAGSTMTQNNTILLNGTNLQIEDAATGYYVHMKPSLGRFEFFAQSGSGATYRSVGLDGTPDDIFMQATDTDGNTYLVGSGVGGTVDGTGVLLQVSKSGALSMINIKADSVVFKFHKGQWNADTVRAGTTTNTLLGWTNGTADNGKIGYITIGSGLSLSAGVLSNTGGISLAAIGASPNANAATLTGTTLNLEPASASFGGVVTTGTQSFAGIKTFTGNLLMSGARLQETAGANVAAANDLTILNGNLTTVTGATQINAITTINWQAGATIGIIFTDAPLVKNNTAGGAGTATLLLAGRVDYQAAAGDYIGFRYDGTNWYETNRKLAASGGVYAFSNLLTESPAGTVKAGGTATANTTFAMGAFNLDITGTGEAFQVHTTTVGNAGIIQNNGAGNGLFAITQAGIGLIAQSNYSSTNDAQEVLRVNRLTTGTAANNIAAKWVTNVENSTGNAVLATEIHHAWSVVDNATRTSFVKVRAVNNTTMTDVLTIHGLGYLQLNPITAAAASAITPAEGMMLFVSDTDGTFTSIGFWGYQNGAWAKM